MRARLLVLAPVACALALAVPSAQQAPTASQRPTFRGDVNYVRVDMYATERGVPVTRPLVLEN